MGTFLLTSVLPSNLQGQQGRPGATGQAGPPGPMVSDYGLGGGWVRMGVLWGHGHLTEALEEVRSGWGTACLHLSLERMTSLSPYRDPQGFLASGAMLGPRERR